MKEPYEDTVDRYIDDRGYLDQLYAQDLPFKMKRIYSTLTRKGVIRGMHGHKEEWKALFVIQGTIKVVSYNMQGLGLKTTILTGNTMLIIPPGWYHGYTPLTPEASVVIFSSATLEESQNDDFRVEPVIEDFDIKNR